MRWFCVTIWDIEAETPDEVSQFMDEELGHRDNVRMLQASMGPWPEKRVSQEAHEVARGR
jgi:hypothetical protein